MKKRLLYLILPIVALVLEILPYGAVCNFASAPSVIHRETFSYFDLVPFGYANFAPLFTAITTCVVLLLLTIYAFTARPIVMASARVFTFVGAVLSLCPILYGIEYYSLVGGLISACLIAQSVALIVTARTATEREKNEAGR